MADAPSTPLRSWLCHPRFQQGRAGRWEDGLVGWQEGDDAIMLWRGLLHGQRWATVLERLNAGDRPPVEARLFASSRDADRCLRTALDDRSGAAQMVAGQLACALLAVAPERYEPAHPLRRVIERREAGVLLAFLAAGANTRVRGPSAPSTPLHHAVRLDWAEGVAFLLAHGADRFTQDELGHPAIHLAARQGRLNALQALLDSGSDLNEMNRQHHTVLGEALLCKTIRLSHLDGGRNATDLSREATAMRLRVVEFLLQRGADLTRPMGKEQRGLTGWQILERKWDAGFLAFVRKTLFDQTIRTTPSSRIRSRL